ncbi:MAG: hypothetical protein J1F36_05835 [Clostridiales bacterium]|nr:hypothetical protein [Clostridiales bacterium]
MNEDIEKAFIKNFIKKQYQERILFEFNSSKKRQHAIDRFSHDFENIINSEKIILMNSNLSILEIEKELKYKKINEFAYVISYKYTMGKFFNLKDALSYLDEEYLPVIIILSNNMALIKSETDKGSSTKMLLYNKVKSEI